MSANTGPGGGCLDSFEDAAACKGEVLERLSVSGASTSVRCEHHDDRYRARVEPILDDINRRYPDSPTPPAWFDPSYAGERWDEDD